ncbi:unnamed protein product, partial [Brassica rapa subsp. trilocularis]
EDINASLTTRICLASRSAFLLFSLGIQAKEQEEKSDAIIKISAMILYISGMEFPCFMLLISKVELDSQWICGTCFSLQSLRALLRANLPKYQGCNVS